MTRTSLVATVLLTVGITLLGEVEAVASVDLPRWITGCWAGARGAERFQENWLAADAGTLLGLSYTRAGGTLASFEFLRIVVKGQQLIYIAQPGGRPPTEFAGAKASGTEVIFENVDHDFPKRVGYRLASADQLLAWIDGGPSAADKRMEFPMARVSCP